MASVVAHLFETMAFLAGVTPGLQKQALWVDKQKKARTTRIDSPPASQGGYKTAKIVPPRSMSDAPIDETFPFATFNGIRPLPLGTKSGRNTPAVPKTEVIASIGGARWVVTVHGANVALKRDGTELAPAEWTGLKLGAVPAEVDDDTRKALDEAITAQLTSDRPFHRVWGWAFDPATPNKVDDVSCRNRETAYRNHQVLVTLEWGLEKDGVFKKSVEVVTDKGETLELPLDAAHLYAQFDVGGGLLNEKGTSWRSYRFPLPMVLDRAKVLAFAFELDSANKIQPYKPAASDVGHKALKEWLDAWDGKGIRDEADNRWIDRAVKGDFMPLPSDLTESMLRSVRAFADETKIISTAPPRFLVVVSLSGCKERPDYEPIGIVGVSRLYPHLMVRSNVAIRSAHASLKLTRPKSTTTHPDKGQPQGAYGCCGALADVGTILVADSNYEWFKSGPIGPDLLYLPLWGGLFAYYLVDPHRAVGDDAKALKGKPMRVVDRSKSARTIDKVGTRLLGIFGQKITEVHKVVRQGQFDNIHVAPRLRQDAPEVYLQKKGGEDIGPAGMIVDVDPEFMKTDEIVMAPFCSHDCFHMHWRWSTAANNTWTLGFDDAGPHRAVGAPMIPTSRDLDLTSWGPNVYTLTEHAMPTSSPADDDSKSIGPLQWQTLFYPGAGYAQGIAELNEVKKVKLRMNVEKFSVSFIGKDKKARKNFEDPPTTYWNLRYYGQMHKGKATAFEWIEMTRAELNKARKE